MNRGANTNVNMEKYERDLAKIEREKLAFEKKQEAFEEQKIREDFESGIRNGVYDPHMPNPLDINIIMIDPTFTWEDNMLINGYTLMDIEKMHQDLMLYITLKSLDLIPKSNVQQGGGGEGNTPVTPTGPVTPNDPSGADPEGPSSPEDNSASPDFDETIRHLRANDWPWRAIELELKKEEFKFSVKAFQKAKERWDAYATLNGMAMTTSVDERDRYNRYNAKIQEEKVNLIYNFIREEKLKNKDASWTSIQKDLHGKVPNYDESDTTSVAELRTLFNEAKKRWDENYLTATKELNHARYGKEKLEYNRLHGSNELRLTLRRNAYRSMPNALSAAESREQFAKLGYSSEDWKEEWEYNHSWKILFTPRRWTAPAKYMCIAAIAAAFMVAANYGLAHVVSPAANIFTPAGAAGALTAGKILTGGTFGLIALTTLQEAINTKAEQREMNPDFLKSVVVHCSNYLGKIVEVYTGLNQKVEEVTRRLEEEQAANRLAKVQKEEADAREAAALAKAAEAEAALAVKSRKEGENAAAVARATKAEEEAVKAADEARKAQEAARVAAENLAAAEKEEKKRATAVNEYFINLKIAEDHATKLSMGWQVNQVIEGKHHGSPDEIVAEAEKMRNRLIGESMRNWCGRNREYVRYLIPSANQPYCSNWVADAANVPAAPASGARGGARANNLAGLTNNVQQQISLHDIKKTVNTLSILQNNAIPEYMKNYIVNQVSKHLAAVNAANNATHSAGYRKTQKRSYRKLNMRKTRAH